MPHSINTTAVGVVADIAGTELSADDIGFIQQPELSGLIFFARNYKNPQQLTELTASIRAIRPDLILTADQEGGRVQRFREGFTRLPAMLTLESLYQNNTEHGLQLAHELGWLMASEVRSCGVHLSYAPVLDIERDLSLVIGDRAFGHDAETVTALAGAFVAGMNEADMLAVGKHFPGHGAVVADSHLSLPIDERSADELQYDIRPFKQLINQQKLIGIMPAHVVYSAVDANNTAGFSPLWLQQILRKALGFNGIIFSDDLSMQGAASVGGYAERTQAAVAAGANALLVCNDRNAAQQVINAVRELQPQHLNLASLQGTVFDYDAERQAQVRARLQQLELKV